MQVQSVTVLTRPYRRIPTTCVTQQAVNTAPVAVRGIHARSMATASDRLDICIEAGVRTSLGNRRTAVQDAETVRDRPNPRKLVNSTSDLANAMTAAVNSFSNLYACPPNNGSRSKHWCCGASEVGPNVVEAGCCDTTLFAPDFGVFANAETVVNTTDPNPSTLATPSSHTVTSPSSVASPMSPSLPEPAVTTTLTSTPTPTPVEPSSGPAQPSQKSVAVGTGVGVPVGVLSLCGLVILFLRERRRRIHAQKTRDDAYTTAEERERKSKTTKPYELHNYASAQELENEHHGPQEISSREVYEANGGF